MIHQQMLHKDRIRDSKNHAAFCSNVDDPTTLTMLYVVLHLRTK
jgi:hypothetical protein